MLDQPKKLHLGCGVNTPEGWINLDGSWNALLAKYQTLRNILKILHVLPQNLIDIPWQPNIVIHDLRKPLPFEDNSLDAVYASHLLEHLYLDEAKRLLKECFRVCRPGGVLRIVVPDLKIAVKKYIDGQFTEAYEDSQADMLNKALLLRQPKSPFESGNIFCKIYTLLKDPHSHKWVYDTDSLGRYFKWAGFVGVGEMQFHQSRIENIENIEEASRMLNGVGICVEGVKPDTIEGKIV